MIFSLQTFSSYPSYIYNQRRVHFLDVFLVLITDMLQFLFHNTPFYCFLDQHKLKQKLAELESSLLILTHPLWAKSNIV